MFFSAFLAMGTEDGICWAMDYPPALPVLFSSSPQTMTCAVNTH